jgi:hypothetical protein
MYTFNNNETHDSNQLTMIYKILKNKEKTKENKETKLATPKNKNKKPVTTFIPNPHTHDYTPEIEEFSRDDLDENVSTIPIQKISSMNIRKNNIITLDQNSTYLLMKNYSVTEPCEEMHRRYMPHSNGLFLHNTPQKMPGSFAWNYNENSLPNFPTIHRGSMISERSTHYNSNNHKKQNLNFEDDGSVDLSGASPYGTNDE